MPRRPPPKRLAPPRPSGPPPFHRLVYALVRRVPHGRIVTYGQVAALIGHPRSARAVGTALRSLPQALVDVVPWQRVMSSSGVCSHRDGFWAGVQRDLLEQEGVTFDARGRVDLRKAAWAPRATAVKSGPPLTKRGRG